MPTWKKSKEYTQKRKLEVLSHYGGKCACCGEGRLVFLALDHIAGGGEKQRKIVGGGGKFFDWIKRKAFPEGFQVLCHNCNFAKHRGICPHKLENN